MNLQAGRVQFDSLVQCFLLLKPRQNKVVEMRIQSASLRTFSSVATAQPTIASSVSLQSKCIFYPTQLARVVEKNQQKYYI